MRYLLAVLMVTISAAVVQAEDAGRAGPANVLVLYRADDADRDKNDKPDSEEVARYYAARRGVPEANLFGVTLGKLKRDYQIDYADFFEKVLKPLADRLAEKGAGDQPLSQSVCYIAVCPGVPTYVNTHHKQPEGQKRDWFARTARRSLDQWLISLDENLAAGVNDETGTPGDVGGRPLGASMRQCTLPLYGRMAAAGAKPFHQLRAESPKQFNFYLVTRLGDTPEHARDMIDGALYAERHLRLPGRDEKPAWRPTIWLDQKYRFAGDAVASMALTVAVVRGAKGSPFARGEGLQQPWPVVIDNQEQEIGLPVKDGPLHKPAVSTKVVGVSKQTVGDDGRTVTLVKLAEPGKAGRGKDIPAKGYFPPGWVAGNGKVGGPIVGVHPTDNAVVLGGDVALAEGDTLTATWPGEFPADGCFLFYGFYGLGKFEDVFQFAPGALGVHVDSSCMRWARGAMDRGIAATFGVTSEPLSIGIPHGHFMVTALACGADWAETVLGSLRLSQRWAGVAFGDPLYAPFRSKMLKDQTPPVLGDVKVEAGHERATITAALAGEGGDQSAEVVQFKLEYGPTPEFGEVIDYTAWPEPEKGRGVKGRRFGWSRSAQWKLTGLEAGKVYHFRVSAKDPAGQEAAGKVGTFTP